MANKSEKLESKLGMVSMTLSVIHKEETTGNHRDNLYLSQSQLMGHMVQAIPVNNQVKLVNTVVSTAVNMGKAGTTGLKTPSHSGNSQFDFSTSIEQS